MKLRLAFALVLMPLACERPRPPPPEPPRFLFESRRPYDAQLDAFRKAGGDPQKSVRPQGPADFTAIEGSRAYVVLSSSVLVIAPTARGMTPAWTHPILAGGQAVLSAGYLRVEKQGDKLTKLFVDADSDAYCPTNEALRITLTALETLKVPREVLRIDHRPAYDCLAGPPTVTATAAAESRVSYGTVMLAVARRFETSGKAIAAKKYDLAAYQLEEIVETFRDELPAASPPPVPAGVSLDAYKKPLLDTAVPDLEKALKGGDAAAIEAAFANTGKTCNACHIAAGKSFIEVPIKPGDSVPKL